MIDIDADLENCTDFDTPAVFATSPATTTVNGIFTPRTEGAPMFGEEVEALKPCFTARTSLVGFVTTKMNVTINATSYKVEKKQDTGTGLTDIWLRTN